MYKYYCKIINKIIPVTLLIIGTIYNPIICQNNKSKDYIKTAFQLTSFLYLQYGFESDHLIQDGPPPNPLDKYFRGKFRWEDDKIDQAKSLSDFLLYGFFISSIPITPLVSEEHYYKNLLTNIQVLSLNGIITNTVKILAKRQRPDSYYKTRIYENDQFRSFFSGHTSTAFAIGTSSAIMLSDSHPKRKNIIWATTYSLAIATGYFRIAADKHYLTDIITGGIVGIIVGNLVQKSKQNSNLTIMPLREGNTRLVNIAIKIY